ncbi:MAG: four helix bundle protein [Chitinivibrionales bacterium]|nr:four helix bundle protein [Chitinivibrionales bacterium]
MAQLNHEKLKVYQKAIEFFAFSNKICSSIKKAFSTKNHLWRASTSIAINIAQANAKSSIKERRNLLCTSFGSILECAACLDIFYLKRCLSSSQKNCKRVLLYEIGSMIIGLLKMKANEVNENQPEYEGNNRDNNITFSHEELEIYKKALAFFEWFDKLCCEQQINELIYQSLDKSSTSLILNIAEGDGRYSFRERSRFIVHAHSAVLSSSSWLDVLLVDSSNRISEIEKGKSQLVGIASMLMAWKRSISSYGT